VHKPRGHRGRALAGAWVADKQEYAAADVRKQNDRDSLDWYAVIIADVFG
jgi:hypothetical protein